MTLLITVFAAIICTVIWYKNAPNDRLNVRTLCFLYWGAALMWMIDACFEYAELGAEFFTPAPADMLNDAYLGLSVVALAMVLWLVILIIKDPEGKVKAAMAKKQ